MLRSNARRAGSCRGGPRPPPCRPPGVRHAGEAPALSDEQPVHAGTPDPAGRVALAFRRESQHGGAIERERRRVVVDNIVFHERGRESRLVVALIAVGRGVRRL